MRTYTTFPSKEEIYKEAVAAIAKVWYEDELEEMREKDRKEGIEQGIERAIRTYLRKRPEVTAEEVSELFEVELSVVHQLMEKGEESSS